MRPVIVLLLPVAALGQVLYPMHYDWLLSEGRTATDDAGREAAYSALNDRLIELAPTIFGYDVQGVFAASNRVRVPALSDPAMAFGLDGMGFSFRLMEMTE